MLCEDWHNLANAIVGEYAGVSGTYARMAERAEAAGDNEVANSFREIAAERQSTTMTSRRQYRSR
jgi:rubrerythrin